MTGFRDKGRIVKVWNKATHYFRRIRTEDLNDKTEQQAASATVSTPVWRKKSVQLVCGALALLIVAGFIGFDQRAKYIEANTVEFHRVYMDGVEVGTVSSPDEVATFIEQKKLAVQQANPDVRMKLDAGEITYATESAFKAVPETESTLAKLDSLVSAYAVGVELKINGEVIGVVKDQETANDILLRVQSIYAPELAAASKSAKSVTALSYNGNEEDAADNEAIDDMLSEPGRIVTEVDFVEEVQMGDIQTTPEDISAPEDIYKYIIEGSTKPTKYVVQAGDCIGCIAQKFEISPQVIYENNPWIQGDRITVGDELDLTVLQPELTVRTIENLIVDEKISPPVEVVKNANMRVGQSKTIQTGAEGEQRLTYKIEKQNGYVVSEELINQEVLVEPTKTIIEKGTMVVLGEGTGAFAIPVKNYRITSSYGKRWGRQHKGVDFVGDKNIMASDSGVIEFVGTKSGLGKTIIINHKNGYKTVYGHLSSYKVKKGDKVEKRDVIGIMGTTGNSTGVHLHFEIHKNGVVQNPMKYL